MDPCLLFRRHSSVTLRANGGSEWPFALLEAQPHRHRAARQTDPCACTGRGFLTDLLLAKRKLRRAGKAYLFTFCYSCQWRIISGAFPGFGAECFLCCSSRPPALRLRWGFGSSNTGPGDGQHRDSEHRRNVPPPRCPLRQPLLLLALLRFSPF